jgi:hypothetical protein
MTSKVNQDVK